MAQMRIQYRVVLPDPDAPSVQQVVQEIHDAAAEAAVEAVRANAPVRSGRFVAHLRAQPAEGGAEVRSDVPYAVYVRRRKGVWREAQRARKVFSDTLTTEIERRSQDIANAVAADALSPLNGGSDG
jgi:restriction endonuclease Mrr